MQGGNHLAVFQIYPKSRSNEKATYSGMQRLKMHGVRGWRTGRGIMTSLPRSSEAPLGTLGRMFWAETLNPSPEKAEKGRRLTESPLLNISGCSCHAQEGDKSVNQFPWADYTSALSQEVLRSFGVSCAIGSHLCKNWHLWQDLD